MEDIYSDTPTSNSDNTSYYDELNEKDDIFTHYNDNKEINSTDDEMSNSSNDSGDNGDINNNKIMYPEIKNENNVNLIHNNYDIKNNETNIYPKYYDNETNIYPKYHDNETNIYSKYHDNETNIYSKYHDNKTNIYSKYHDYNKKININNEHKKILNRYRNNKYNKYSYDNYHKTETTNTDNNLIHSQINNINKKIIINEKEKIPCKIKVINNLYDFIINDFEDINESKIMKSLQKKKIIFNTYYNKIFLNDTDDYLKFINNFLKKKCCNILTTKMYYDNYIPLYDIITSICEKAKILSGYKNDIISRDINELKTSHLHIFPNYYINNNKKEKEKFIDEYIIKNDLDNIIAIYGNYNYDKQKYINDIIKKSKKYKKIYNIIDDMLYYIIKKSFDYE